MDWKRCVGRSKSFYGSCLLSCTGIKDIAFHHTYHYLGWLPCVDETKSFIIHIIEIMRCHERDFAEI